MKIAILTSGILPVPAVQGGAVENLIDYYLEYNNCHQLHDITVYSVWHPDVKRHPALQADCNHYRYIDTSSLWAKVRRKVYGLLHRHEYYNFFIEYYFERVWQDIRRRGYDCIVLENRPGYAVKLSQRGVGHMVLHLHNDLLNAATPRHQEVFQSLARILTVSDYIKGRVHTIAQGDKVETVHNGIDITRFSTKSNTDVSRQAIGFSDNDFVIVYSGRINREKGVSELIDAMLLLNNYPNIKLIILGSSFFNDAKDDNEFLRSLKDKAETIKDNIFFTGFIPYSKVPDYLHIANIATLPSMWDEPFGLTIVEAMAAGLPLITTRSGGIPEICKGVATIVDREDVVTNLTHAILNLYQHPEKRDQMAKASVERARLFDKETYAKNFLNALEVFLG